VYGAPKNNPGLLLTHAQIYILPKYNFHKGKAPVSERSKRQYMDAIHHFRAARFQADLKRVWAGLSGKSVGLLAYEDVRQKLHATPTAKRELREIPLDSIVGSVNRYNDFTRSFLPLRESDQTRWATIDTQFQTQAGLPPIEVYQIGEVYFVIDGNHRVSVAQQMDAGFIEAYVTEVETKVPIDPDTQPDDLILKARYADFLTRTQLKSTRPQADLTMTVPGNYRVLDKEITVHRYALEQQQQRAVSLPEGTRSWYDQIYLPLIEIIHARGMLRDFPNRTEADMYVWIAKHTDELKAQWGWQIEPETAISNLVGLYSRSPKQVLNRVGEKLLGTVARDLLDRGPPPGQWRHEKERTEAESRLFSKILVSVNGHSGGWRTLAQALLLAEREQATISGLHFIDEQEPADSPENQATATEFKQRCSERHIPAEFAFETGNIARVLNQRAREANLLVINLGYELQPSTLNRLSANLDVLLRRCPRPILAVTATASPLDSILLAYDGSAKAKEALFVAAYFGGQWRVPLTVLSVTEESAEATNTALQRARKYLESQQIEATYIQRNGLATEAILETAREQGNNLIMMGGHSHPPLVEVVMGSTVNTILRSSPWPVLVCR
jgi:nucleotide-binding universal stress UspA family protein